jgi:hypothetical protein
MKNFKVWVDADACPKMVKEVVFKACNKLQIELILVANSYMQIPESPFIRLIIVENGDDVADQYIVDNLDENDLVITADIPLAAFVVEKKALAINPRGELYTEENIRERLSVRDFMADLRDSGVDTGGPSAFDLKDKEKFANSFNRMVTKLLK